MDWAVILAGGSGTRFWPLSTPSRPKQLLPLAGPVPTAVAAVRAIEPLVSRDRILVVTGGALAGPLQGALGLRPDHILIEPRAASTAPALVWATAVAARRDPEAALVSMHADWHLGTGEAFREAAARSLAVARRLDLLVTTGLVPTRVESGYGHIVPGEPIAEGARRVARFTEKPPRPEAERLTAAGALWNSGLFAWTASRLLAEVRACTPEVATALDALEAGDVARYFTEVTPVSIDVGVFERSSRVAVLAGDFPWDDVGDWAALARVRGTDPQGNVLEGQALAVDTAGCIAWGDSMPVVLYGVRDLVVVEAHGRVLVLPRERAARLKELLDALPPEVRDLE